MYKAAIDIGSNSSRLLIGTVNNNNLKLNYQKLVNTRLAKNMQDGFLATEGYDKTVDAMQIFAKELDYYQLPGKPIILATEAIRTAKNGGDLVNKIEEDFSWPVKILTGADEAKLTYLGAVSGVKKALSRTIVVLDIGGASTEIVWQNKENLFHTKSIPVGAVKILDEPENWQDRIKLLKEDLPNEKLRLIGVGGTITTVAALSCCLDHYRRSAIQGLVLSRAMLRHWRNRIASVPVGERNGQWPLLKGREDSIITGLDILEQVLIELKLEEITISDYGLLDGALIYYN